MIFPGCSKRLAADSKARLWGFKPKKARRQKSCSFRRLLHVKHERKQEKRAAGHRVFLTEFECFYLHLHRLLGQVGVDHQGPVLAGAALARERELDYVTPRVEDHQQGCVAAALADAGRLSAAIEHEPETLRALPLA